MKLAGIILAAGASRRMGQPKALLEYQGRTFVDRLVECLTPACDPVIVVLGHHAVEIRAKAKRLPLSVENPDPERGMLSSLQCALRAVPSDVEGVAFTPVDCPAVRFSTVMRLAAAFRNRPSGSLFVVPSFENRRGHPVFFDASLIDGYLALPPTGTSREIMDRHPANTHSVPVDDPGVLNDVDNWEAYLQLTAAGGG